MTKYAKEGVCPLCNSENIEFEVAEVDFPTGVVQPCTCLDCGAKFDEWYDLSFSGQWNITADKVGEDEPYRDANKHQDN